MPSIATVNKSLWTPEGEIAINPKGIIKISQPELIMLSWLHKFAQKYGLTVVCQRCDHAITGKNSGHEQSAAVSCLCREFRFSR